MQLSKEATNQTSYAVLLVVAVVVTVVVVVVVVVVVLVVVVAPLLLLLLLNVLCCYKCSRTSIADQVVSRLNLRTMAKTLGGSNRVVLCVCV